MFKTEIVIILVLVALIIVLAGYHYIFHIYEIDYRINPEYLYADYSSEVTIEVIPVNSLGFRAPFRNPKTKISVEEGKDLVEIVRYDKDESVLVLRSLGQTGIVTVRIVSEYSIFPSVIEVKIIPASAEATLPEVKRVT